MATPPVFDGVCNIVVAGHTEDNESKSFMPWTVETFALFLARFKTDILGFEALGIPFSAEIGYDFAILGEQARIDGMPLFAWGQMHGVTWNTRAHAASDFSAADAAFILERNGIRFSGILGSCEHLSDYVSSTASIPVKGKKFPQAEYRYNVITGLATSFGPAGQANHKDETSLAGIRPLVPDGSVVLVEGGNGFDIAALQRTIMAVATGDIKTSVVKLMFTMGRGNEYPTFSADYMGYPTTGDTALQAIQWLTSHTTKVASYWRFLSFAGLLSLWRENGAVPFEYDARI